MAFSFKCTRYSAIAQLVLGVLSIIFGIADRATIFIEYGSGATHTKSVVPIWIGVWFVITGIIGCFGCKHSCASNRKAFQKLVGTYLGFSIVSVVFACVLGFTYVVGVGNIMGGSPCRYKVDRSYILYFNYTTPTSIKSLEKECNTSVALGSLIIIFAILEFVIGIWASICCCREGCCDCCKPGIQQPTQTGQVVYIQTQHGQEAYVMTQGANGVSVAAPTLVPATAAHQVMYPSLPVYSGAIVDGAQGVGSQAGAGAQGGVTHDAQATPLEAKSNNIPPPPYQP